jgi:hypothetical protein
MKRFALSSVLLLAIGVTGALVYAYMPPTPYTWGPGDPNYNPMAAVHPGTIDTSQLTYGDFVGVSPGQPNAVSYGDSGLIVGWDDSWVSGIGHPNTNGDALDGLWVQIYSSGGWWDLGAPTSRVVVFTSQDHGPYLAEGLEYRVFGSNTLWGGVSPQAGATDVYLDGWRPHNPLEDINRNGWTSDDIAGVYQLPGHYRYVQLVAWSQTGTLNEPEVDAVAAMPPECDPAPNTQGYWHRQCLGAGLITPGRNGRGPQTILEPDFLKTLVPAVNARLQASIFLPSTFLTCEDGMDAVPPSDKCEKALKQYTALLLNLESDRLQDSCDIDLSLQGCSAATIADLVDELAALINTGDADSCRVASDCAGAVNENEGIVVPAASLIAPNGGASLFGVGLDIATPATTSDVPSAGTTADPPQQTSVVDASPAPPVSEPVSATGNPEVLTVDAPTAVDSSATVLVPYISNVGSPVASQVAVEEAIEDAAADVTDTRKTIGRHLAMLANASVPESARKVSRDALLTALGGGYEPEVRLEIVRGLLGKLDVAYNSLLAKHLEDIRIEAQEFSNEKVAKEAMHLLKSLAPSVESAE